MVVTSAHNRDTVTVHNVTECSDEKVLPFGLELCYEVRWGTITSYNIVFHIPAFDIYTVIAMSQTDLSETTDKTHLQTKHLLQTYYTPHV